MKHIALYCALLINICAHAMENASSDMATAIPHLAARAIATTVCSIPFNASANMIVNRCADPSADTLKIIAKALCSFYISNQVSSSLTNLRCIPPAPATADLQEGLSHLAISSLVGYATNKIMAVPCNKLMKNISKNYKKKEHLIASVTREFQIEEDAQLDTALLYFRNNSGAITLEWEPEINKATQHINVESVKDMPTVTNFKHTESKIRCKLSQQKGAIFVSESILPNESANIYCLATKYKTANTERGYMRPFGIHNFRPEIMKLHQAVLDNHITAIGVPLQTIMKSGTSIADDRGIDL